MKAATAEKIKFAFSTLLPAFRFFTVANKFKSLTEEEKKVAKKCIGKKKKSGEDTFLCKKVHFKRENTQIESTQHHIRAYFINSEWKSPNLVYNSITKACSRFHYTISECGSHSVGCSKRFPKSPQYPLLWNGVDYQIIQAKSWQATKKPYKIVREALSFISQQSPLFSFVRNNSMNLSTTEGRVKKKKRKARNSKHFKGTVG